jgi:hypothetical protein
VFDRGGAHASLVIWGALEPTEEAIACKPELLVKSERGAIGVSLPGIAEGQLIARPASRGLGHGGFVVLALDFEGMN